MTGEGPRRGPGNRDIVVLQGGGGRDTPAEPSRGERSAAVGGDIASHTRFDVGDVGVVCRDVGGYIVGGETQRIAVASAHSVGGIGPYIVGDACRQGCQGADESIRAGTARGGVVVGQSGILLRAPADTLLEDGLTAVGEECAPGDGGGIRDVRDGDGSDFRNRVGEGGKGHLGTVGGA